MRRFFGWVGVLIGSFLLVVLGIGIYLMIAPGTSLLGIKYIKATDGTNTEIVATYTEEVKGDLVFDTNRVPVVIEYVPYTNFEFTFVQKFNGFTRTKIDKPSISVSVNQENGDLVVKTAEFIPFLWGNNSDGYSLYCKIPATYGTSSNPKSLTVTSEKSKVSVTTNKDASSNINDLVIQTKGAVELSGNHNIRNIVIANTTRNIDLPETISAENISINCGNKSVSIAGDISNKLTFKSANGSLKFKNCGTLEAESNSGNIISTADGVSVYGNATISTGGKGKVELQRVEGNLNVNANGGTIAIGQKTNVVGGVAGKVDIVTKNGWVYLYGDYNSTEYANITTKGGKIFVGNNSRSDNEKLSGPIAKIANIAIETNTGAVSVEQVTNIKVNAKTANVEVGRFTNTANITTTSGDVKVGGNVLGGMLTICTGKNGNVTAKNLGGEACIVAGGSVYAQFASVIGKIDIAGAKKDVTVVLPDVVTTSTNYIWVESNKTSADIHLADIEKSGKIYHSVDEVPAGGENKLIKVTSTSGKIRVCSKNFE